MSFLTASLALKLANAALFHKIEPNTSYDRYMDKILIKCLEGKTELPCDEELTHELSQKLMHDGFEIVKVNGSYFIKWAKPYILIE